MASLRLRLLFLLIDLLQEFLKAHSGARVGVFLLRTEGLLHPFMNHAGQVFVSAGMSVKFAEMRSISGFARTMILPCYP